MVSRNNANSRFHDAIIGLNSLAKNAYTASYNAGWWHDPVSKEPLVNNPYVIATKIALIHSEVSEALEGHRRGLMDDKLPHRSMSECELADTLIRVFDLAGALELDLSGAVSEKMFYNISRPDHTISHRTAVGGKKY